MLWFILVLMIFGLVAGAIARAIVPGNDSMGIVGTIVLGIVGSFVGGFLGRALFNKNVEAGSIQASGIIGSILGAIVVLLVYRIATRRSAH
jgi:uncharacterized membrane protein YeaQ/YmgE (transglycosylase-associated protein family)